MIDDRSDAGFGEEESFENTGDGGATGASRIVEDAGVDLAARLKALWVRGKDSGC